MGNLRTPEYPVHLILQHQHGKISVHRHGAGLTEAFRPYRMPCPGRL